MLSANEIAGFLNQLFFKLMKQSYFWHVDANSRKPKVDWKFF